MHPSPASESDPHRLVHGPFSSDNCDLVLMARTAAAFHERSRLVLAAYLREIERREIHRRGYCEKEEGTDDQFPRID